MNKNTFKNASWKIANGIMPKYYKSLGKLHYDECVYDGARLCSLSFSRPAFEKILYEPLVSVMEFSKLMIGLVIRGNDVQSVKFIVHFYNEDGALIQSYSEDVASEITPQFKNITVTYKIPFEATHASIEYHFNGVATGVSFFKPSLFIET